MVEIMLHLALINWFWGSRKVNLSCTKIRVWFMLKTTWTSYTNRKACPHGIQDDNKNHQVGEKKKLTMNIPVFKPLGSSHKCANINLPCKLEHSMCPLINNWQTPWDSWQDSSSSLWSADTRTNQQRSFHNINYPTLVLLKPLKNYIWSQRGDPFMQMVQSKFSGVNQTYVFSQEPWPTFGLLSNHNLTVSLQIYRQQIHIELT